MTSVVSENQGPKDRPSHENDLHVRDPGKWIGFVFSDSLPCDDVLCCPGNTVKPRVFDP